MKIRTLNQLTAEKVKTKKGTPITALKEVREVPTRVYKKLADKRTKTGKRIAFIRKYVTLHNIRLTTLYVIVAYILVMMYLDLPKPAYVNGFVNAETVTTSETKVVDSWQVSLKNNFVVQAYEGKEDIKQAIIDYCSPLGEEAVKFYLYAGFIESNVTRSPANWSDDHTSWCHGEKGKGSHGLFHFSKCTYAGLGGKDIHDPIEQVKIVCQPKVYANKAHYWYWTTKKFYGSAK